MPSFQGGPLGGMAGFAPGMDPPPEQLAASADGGDGSSLDAAGKFDRILADARELAASDGNFSEADKLILEQVTSLLQKLKASGEKNQQQAISGKMSPAVGQAYA